MERDASENTGCPGSAPAGARADRAGRGAAGLKWCAALAAAGLLALLPHGVVRAASLAVSPTSAAAGAPLTVTGSGWQPNGAVDVYWTANEQNGSASTSPDVRIATVQADAAGNVSSTITAAVPNAAITGLSSGPFCPTSVSGEAVQGYSETTAGTSVAQSVYFSPWLVATYPSVGGASLQFNNADATYLLGSVGPVVVAGCGFTPGHSFTLSFPGQSPITGTVAADGSVSPTVDIASIPAYTTGTATLSDGTLSASFPVVLYSPTLQVSPSSVQPGGSFTVSGTGLTPNEPLSVVGYSGPDQLGAAPTGASTAADGSFSFTWAVPASQTSGTYTISVVVPSGASASGGQVVVGSAGTAGGGTSACPAGPYQLRFTQQPPANLTDGSQSFSVAAAVYAADGSVDTCNFEDNIALFLVPPGGSPGLLDGTTTARSLDGAVSFSGLTVTGAGGSGYVLQVSDASNSAVASSQSTSLTFPPLPVPTRVVLTSQPPPVMVMGQTITVSGAVYDQYGHLYTGGDSLSFGVIDSSGNLHCDCATPPTDQGIATSTVQMTDVTAIGTGLTLQLTDGDNTKLTASSQPFELLAANTLFNAAGGQWGVPLPAYEQGSDAGLQLPIQYAGVQFTLRWVQGTHAYLAGDSLTQQICVDSSWKLNVAGNGVSASLSGSGCQAPVDLASLNLPTGTYGAQLVLSTASSGTHYGTNDIVLYSLLPPGLTGCPCWPMPLASPLLKPLDLQFVQPAPIAVGAQGSVDINVAAAPRTVEGVHAETTWDPEALAVRPVAPAGHSLSTGIGGPGLAGMVVSGATAIGGTALRLEVSCLQVGTFSLGLSGSWWAGTDLGTILTSISTSGSVTCSSPGAGPATVPGAVVNPADGTLEVTVTGSGLGAAAKAVLAGAGGVAETASAVSPSGAGTSLVATFPATPAGPYTLTVTDGGGTVLAQVPDVEVPPSTPFFVIDRADRLGQVPGFHEPHAWGVANVGSQNGVAVVAFTFPGYVSPEPALEASSLAAGVHYIGGGLQGGEWVELAAVPVPAGQSVDVAWAVTVPPSAVFGTSAPAEIGDGVPMPTFLVGTLTGSQWQSIQTLSGTALGTQIATLSNHNLQQALGGLLALDAQQSSAYEASLRTSFPLLVQQLYDGERLQALGAPPASQWGYGR